MVAEARSRDVAGKDYWRALRSGSAAQTYKTRPLWHAAVAPYLPRRSDWTVFEVGCVPGGLLAYFHKEFGYNVAGLDYTPHLDLVRATLVLNDVPAAELFEADFLQFTSARQYDVVFSHGFIEHFEHYVEVIKKHVALVRPGGYLVLIVPNYTHVQYLLHKVFDAENLTRHRFEVMRPRALLAGVAQCGMVVDYCGYVGTFDYWVVRRGTGLRRWCVRCAEHIAEDVRRGLTCLGLGDIRNRFLSPFVVCIAHLPPS